MQDETSDYIVTKGIGPIPQYIWLTANRSSGPQIFYEGCKGSSICMLCNLWDMDHIEKCLQMNNKITSEDY